MAVGDGDFPDTGLVVPETSTLSTDEMVAFAVEAERAGIDSLWCSEGWGYSPFSLLGRLSEVTDCPLGTGIASVYARTPAAIAMEALTLHEATDGRFFLGLGTSTPAIAEQLHGTAFDRPVRRLREAVEIIRSALAGGPIEYDGAVFAADGYALDHVDQPVEVPILNAALGPLNVAMSVDRADGIVTYLMPIERIPDAIEAGATRAGTTADARVVAQVPTCVSADGEKARAVLARHLAYYVGAHDAYHAVVARHGFSEVAERIRNAWRAGDHDRARSAVSEELMDAVGVVGTPARARTRFEAICAGPVDTAVLSFPADTDAEMRRAALEIVSG